MSEPDTTRQVSLVQILVGWVSTQPTLLRDTMVESTGTSERIRSTAQDRRLWYALAAGGLLLVIAGGLAAWLTWHRQVQAITEIERLGGAADLVPVGPDWLRMIVGDEVMTGYDRVTAVYLSNLGVTDADLVHIKGLTELERLVLNNLPVTDAGLMDLKELATLVILELNHTQVTNAGMVHLKGLTRLNVLELIGTQVTDAGLIHLSGLKELAVLELHGTDVTDAGMLHLKELTKLEGLGLSNTYVTETGLLTLKTALPSCRVSSY